jgi:hypothetical protein
LFCSPAQALDSRTRQEMFADFVKERERREREEKKARKKARLTAFRDLLEDTPSIKVGAQPPCLSSLFLKIKKQ